MSEVLDELAASADPVARDLARALRVYQQRREGKGLNRSIGYEPRDIRQYGAVAVIESRVRNQSSGFDFGPAAESYEAIVLRHPDRFAADVVTIARGRMGAEDAAFEPTADLAEMDQQVRELLARSIVPFPKGIAVPKRATATSTVFFRDPRVKAYVLKRARGTCEACGEPAPFRTALGLEYLEVHHMKPLAEGGSDRVQNAVALCPNCHRAMHNAEDATRRADRLYAKFRVELIRE